MARSFRLNLNLPDDLHIAIAREAEVSRRPVQDVIREALYGTLMDGCDRQDELRGILCNAFAAGATNEEARDHARRVLDFPVSLDTVAHYRWRQRCEDPSTLTSAQAKRIVFKGAT